MQKQNIFLHNLGQIITFIKILELHVLLNNIKATLTVVTHTKNFVSIDRSFLVVNFSVYFVFASVDVSWMWEYLSVWKSC